MSAFHRQRNPTGVREEYNAYSPGAGVQQQEEDDPNNKDTRLKSRISMLKEVSISIGDEIREQNRFLAWATGWEQR
ncbi:hypothetical protein BX667DRAFT_517528 [Coemansia mojavensis]|nr:hypothetical protein BX667DRAFT_517528 [Coemansia mojavensis]